MNIKTYRIWQLITVAVVGAVVGMSAIWGTWIPSLAAVVAGMAVTLIIRRNVKGIIADERNYTVAYKASRITIAIGMFCLTAAGLILVAINRNNLDTTQSQTGFALLYATCGLMVIYNLAYTYYNRKLGGK
jgi:uncharacterized membrane protein